MNRLFDNGELYSATPAASLDHLRKLERHFGSYRLVRAYLRRWLKPGCAYRLLDLAAGTGDVPRLIVEWARKKSVSLQIDGIDPRPAVLEAARKLSIQYPEIAFIRADPRSFTSSMTYDVVCCSFALHQFGEDDAARLMRQARELSHDKTLVTDLVRSQTALWTMCLVSEFFCRETASKKKARLSVRNAFSFDELNTLANRAGWINFGHRIFFPGRQAIWMSQREEAPALSMELPQPDFAI